jgi:multisubunit Na+/H+ antiporter MnhB subunit
MPINLSLGLTLGLFVVASLFDLGGEQLARVALPIMLAVGVGFFLFTLWKPGTFMTFLAYEALAMIFALGAYGYLFFNDSLAGAGWLAVGILVTILAALVQATGKAGKGIVWYFDNNGVFHVVQMLGLVLLWLGLVA